MKKENSGPCMTVCPQSVLLALMAFILICAGTAWLAGYEITLRAPGCYSAVVSICALASAYIAAKEEKVSIVCDRKRRSVLLPLSLMYSMVMLWLADWEMVLAQILVCLICCIYLGWRSAGKTLFGRMCKGISLLICPLFLLLLFCSIVLSDFGITRIVESVLSPERRYEAQLIDVDEGALGGSTIVDVKDLDNVMDLGLVRFDSVNRIYRTGWGAFENMQIVWKDEHTLLIDGQAYDVRR